ncbi:MAG: phosphatase PAP2 family protein [Calditrichaeota bacterium]|nr:phosphatase PAP2 family protein [Calditrichota bacterium]
MNNNKTNSFIVFLILSQIGLFTSDVFAQNSSQNMFERSPDYKFPFALIVVSFFVDRSVQKMALKNKTTFNDNIFEIDRYYGDKYVTGASLLGLYGISYLADSDQMKRLSEKAILSTVVTGAVVVSLKELFGRSRPYRNQGTLHFKPFAFKESRRSFPSGHAAVTFAISTVFANEIDNPWWKTFWYGSATAVAAARIYRNDHWLSDVLTGGALGHFIALKTSEMYENKKATPVFGMALVQENVVLSMQIKF